MGSEDTVSFLASLQAEHATLLARCEQLEKQVWEAEQERDRLASFGSKQEQAIKEHLLRCERAEARVEELQTTIDARIAERIRELVATVAAMKNLWHEADAENKAICDALHEGEHAFDPVAKAKALVTTVAACKACMNDLLASPKGVVPQSCERFYRNGAFDVAETGGVQ